MDEEQIKIMNDEMARINREAHLIQNNQMDKYLNKVLEKNIDSFTLELYRSEKSPIPGVVSHVNLISNFNADDLYFARHLEIFVSKVKVGDAVFKARPKDGMILCEVEEIIKTSE